MEKKKTECKCPTCKVKHFMDLRWIGKLPAPKMCTNCYKMAQNRSSSIYNGAGATIQQRSRIT